MKDNMVVTLVYQNNQRQLDPLTSLQGVARSLTHVTKHLILITVRQPGSQWFTVTQPDSQWFTVTR